MSLSGILFDIKRYAIHDGPGIRTTVFLKGCPLNCIWCHNPEGMLSSASLLYRPDRCIGCLTCQTVCPQEAVSRTGETMTTDTDACTLCGECAQACPAEARLMAGFRATVGAVIETVAKDAIFYDQSAGGVTFSGGEPLRQPEFLAALLDGCGRLGIHRAVDTSGYAEPETIMGMAPLTDLFLYDLKIMDAKRHRQYTGCSNDPVLANLKRLVVSNAAVLVRFPLIPGITDDADNIEQMGAFLTDLPVVPKVQLIPYHRSAQQKYRRFGLEYALAGVSTPSLEQVQQAKLRLTQMGIHVSTGG